MHRSRWDGGSGSTLGQDGFSADVSGARRRMQQSAAPAAPVSSAPAAYATVGRRVVAFSDNGDGTLTATGLLDRQADDLDIQFEAGERPVVAIAPHAFEGSALRRVALPDSLRQIGEMAFSGCAHLTAVSIPSAVARVGTLAFAKCASLSRVVIGPGVQAIGPSCFSKCVNLTRVDVPSSVQSFGGGVFFGCGRQLTLHGAAGSKAEQYAKLYGVAFDSESWRQDEQLILQEEADGTLTVLGPRQEAPTLIDIPSELCGRRIARIAPKAFFACGTLERLIVGGGVREIGESAFFGCRSLAALSLERGLERVGDSAFAGCERISQVTFPYGMGCVGRMAFFGCTRLAYVKLPAATRIEDFAFDGCAPGMRVFGGVHVGRIPHPDGEMGQNA